MVLGGSAFPGGSAAGAARSLPCDGALGAVDALFLVLEYLPVKFVDEGIDRRVEIVVAGVGKELSAL